MCNTNDNDAGTIELDSNNISTVDQLLEHGDFADRVLWIDSEITNNTMRIMRRILRYNMEDIGVPVHERKPILIVFFSGGGSGFVADSIIDTILTSETPVYGFNVGVCGSAACLIYMACHKRFALKSAHFVLHYGSFSLDGNALDMFSFTRFYERSLTKMESFIMEHSSITLERLEDEMVRDWYITAQEAHGELGFVDTIVSTLTEVF